jgi:hypothetical protein
MTISDPRLSAELAFQQRRLSSLRAAFLVANHNGIALRPEGLPALVEGDMAVSVASALVKAGFRTKLLQDCTWAAASELGTAYPALLPMRDGRWVILVLVVVKEEGPMAAILDPAARARACADWIERKVPLPGNALAPASGYAHKRIRIGYLSTDFYRHAMSFLIAELLERHDRERVEVYGYCASPENGIDIRQRVIAAFDHFIPISSLTDAQAAARIRADEIDILIDLNGLKKGARLEILRWKPAPVQATYLGCIDPVPLPELDYILCDAVTIPPEMDAAYSPQPLRIEGCYQANDSTPPRAVPVSQAEEGLPQDAFVFCCAKP